MKILSRLLFFLLFASQVFADTPVWFTNFEAGTMSDGASAASEYRGSSSGTTSIGSVQAHSGTYSLRSNPTGAAVGRVFFGAVTDGALGNGSLVTSMNTADLYFEFWFRYATQGNEEILVVSNNVSPGASTYVMALRLSSSKLVIYDTNPSLVQTGATTVSANVWHRINVHSQVGASGVYSVSLDGAVELSGTMDQGAVNIAGVSLGKTVNRSSASVDQFFDDLIMDKSTDPAGNRTITELIPTGAGTTHQWTAGTNGSTYLEEDEVGLCDGDTTVTKTTGTAGDVEEVNVTDTGAAGITGAIIALYPRAVIRETSTVTSSDQTGINSAGTRSYGTGANYSTNYSSSTKLFATDPATSLAWTSGGVDAVQVSIKENNAVAVQATQLLIRVLWDSSTPPTPTPTATPTATATPTNTATPTPTATPTDTPTPLPTQAGGIGLWPHIGVGGF